MATKADKKEYFQNFADHYMFMMAWVIFLVPIFASVVPLLLVAFMVVFALLAAPRVLGAGTLGPLDDEALIPLYAWLAFAAYVMTSSLWSASPQTALGKGTLVALLVLCIRFSSLLMNQMTPWQLHRCARGIVVGLLIGLAFLVIEFATDNWILTYVARTFSGLVKTVGDTHQIEEHHYNTSMTAVVLFLWPALFVTKVWKNKHQKNLFLTALLGSIFFILYKTESATAQMAFLLSAVVYVGARLVSGKIDVIARTLWLVAVVGVVPIVMAIHFVGVQNLDVMPFSFKDRIQIWNYTAHETLAHPILGIGVRSSRKDRSEQRPKAISTPLDKSVGHPGWHSHNMFLQTWYELGAVGAMFLLAAGLLVLSAIRKQPPYARPFVYASFASVCVVAGVGYGMWQSWLLACFGWTAIFLLMALGYGKYQDQPKTEI